jgi:hypothetical protein
MGAAVVQPGPVCGPFEPVTRVQIPAAAPQRLEKKSLYNSIYSLKLGCLTNRRS